MKEKDIILSVCGVDDYGEPKGCVTVNFAKWYMEEQREEVIKGLFTNEPVIHISRTPRLTMVDLTFEMGEGSDFHELLDVLCMSSEPGNAFDEEEDVMPVLYITIMPYEYEMEYFITGMHGVWCLMPSVPKGEIDMVRLIFDNELFSVYQVDQEVLDALNGETAYLAGEDSGDRENLGDEENLDGALETDGQEVSGDGTGNGAENFTGGGFKGVTGEILEGMDEDIWRD